MLRQYVNPYNVIFIAAQRRFKTPIELLHTLRISQITPGSEYKRPFLIQYT